MNQKILTVTILTVLGLSACAVTPTGPNVAVMPGTNKSFEQFRFDDSECRLFAQQQNGVGTTESSFKAGATSAAIGTAVGALAGAAIGGNSQGAAIGAGGGLLLGSAIGADSGRDSSSTVQRRYDNSYTQCMYAKGHQVPLAGRLVSNPNPVINSPAVNNPPPPAGLPPPPPSSTSNSNTAPIGK